MRRDVRARNLARKVNEALAHCRPIQRTHPDVLRSPKCLTTEGPPGPANGSYFYNRGATCVTGYPISDPSSGFRAMRARLFKRFPYLLPNGFYFANGTLHPLLLEAMQQAPGTYTLG